MDKVRPFMSLTAANSAAATVITEKAAKLDEVELARTQEVETKEAKDLLKQVTWTVLLNKTNGFTKVSKPFVIKQKNNMQEKAEIRLRPVMASGRQLPEAVDVCITRVKRPISKLDKRNQGIYNTFQHSRSKSKDKPKNPGTKLTLMTQEPEIIEQEGGHRTELKRH